VAKGLLRAFGIRVGSFVVSVGGVRLPVSWENGVADWWHLHELAEERSLRIPDAAVDARARLRVDEAREEGDTLGGTFLCFATGVPVGLGSHVCWDERLDGRLGRAFLSIPAIKAVEVGLGSGVADLPGSLVHDEIFPANGRGDPRRGCVRRETNRAGGLEGGITNGEDVWVVATMKPIPTLMKPLHTVDLATGLEALAARERSDVCAVPAASVVGEAALALELAGALLDKLGGDCLEELLERFGAYLERVAGRWPSSSS
jgi:chorismate synthase